MHNEHTAQMITPQDIREITWNLCKIYDLKNKHRSKIGLSNFITLALELRFGSETKNNYRGEWQKEVTLFCQQYGYSTQ